MKVQVSKLYIDKLVNVLSGLSVLKTKIDDLLVAYLKTVPIDLKKKTKKQVMKIVIKLLKRQNTTN